MTKVCPNFLWWNGKTKKKRIMEMLMPSTQMYLKLCYVRCMGYKFEQFTDKATRNAANELKKFYALKIVKELGIDQ